MHTGDDDFQLRGLPVYMKTFAVGHISQDMTLLYLDFCMYLVSKIKCIQIDEYCIPDRNVTDEWLHYALDDGQILRTN